MNILIAYTTNSGSTLLIAERIQATLQADSHQVTLKEIKDTSLDELNNYDLILFGSPSWDYEGKEGQPLFRFFEFFELAKDANWSGKKFAIFGCGDRTYMFFCGACDVIKEFVTAHQGQVIGESLKIDRFYFNDQEAAFRQTEGWVKVMMMQAKG